MTAQDLLQSHTKHRLTVDEFLLLDREGAFGDRRTELLDGDIYHMSPKHRPHARMLGEMCYVLRQAIEAADLKLGILMDISVRLSDHDVPEPDLVITDAPDGEGILPGEAARLVVEIADSTRATDLGVKASLYAAGEVPEYWVLDLQAGRLHQFWAPVAGSYTLRQEAAPGTRVEAWTLPGLAVDRFPD